MMSLEINISVKVIFTDNFSTELINEFYMANEYKINRLSAKQTDEKIWLTIPITIKVKYFIYLLYKKSGNKIQPDINQFIILAGGWL